jgi:hypothetical protein
MGRHTDDEAPAVARVDEMSGSIAAQAGPLLAG